MSKARAPLPCRCHRHDDGKTGIVKLAAGVSFSLCRLCPWLNAPALTPAFGLKLIAAPSIPMSDCEKSFIQPVRPAGMKFSNLGAVLGKLFDRLLRNWQLPVTEKLSAFSASSYKIPKIVPS